MTGSVEHLRHALADRYAVERELGRGGNAVVYLAHDKKNEPSGRGWSLQAVERHRRVVATGISTGDRRKDSA